MGTGSWWWYWWWKRRRRRRYVESERNFFEFCFLISFTSPYKNTILGFLLMRLMNMEEIKEWLMKILMLRLLLLLLLLKLRLGCLWFLKRLLLLLLWWSNVVVFFFYKKKCCWWLYEDQHHNKQKPNCSSRICCWMLIFIVVQFEFWVWNCVAEIFLFVNGMKLEDELKREEDEDYSWLLIFGN